MRQNFTEKSAGVLFLLAGPLAYFAPLSFAGLVFVLLVPVALMAGWEILPEMRRIGWYWLPLMMLAAVSAAWSLDSTASLLLALRVTAIGLGGIALAAGLSRLPAPVLTFLAQALAIGFCIGGLIEISETFDGAVLAEHVHPSRPATWGMIGYSRGAAIHAILALPLSIGLWRLGARRLAIVQFLIAALAIGMGYQMGAKAAIAAGFTVAAALAIIPRLRWLLPAVLLITALSLPWVLPVTLTPAQSCWLGAHKPTGLHRILIWNFVDAHIREYPVAGWGLDAARRIPGGHQHAVVYGCNAPADTPPVIDGEILPLHPHNAILQVWLELGGLGAIAGFGALAYALVRGFTGAGPGKRLSYAMIGGGFASTVAIGLVSFGIWQEWLLGAELVITAVVVSLAKAAERQA